VLPLFILIPLAGVALLNLPFAGALRKRAFALVLLLSAMQITVVVVHPAGFWAETSPMDRFVALDLKAGQLSLVMLLSIGIALFAAALVGHCTFRDDRQRSHFVSVLLISLIGMNGAVLVTDLFSLYVFLEVASVASFILIAFNRDLRGLEGAFKYIVLSAVATVLMVSAVALLMMMAGGTSFGQVKAALKASQGATLARLAMGAFVCGLFIKGGLVPFHGWVLGAYSAAPAPASVLLAGIATKVSGIYALVRLATTVFPPSESLNQVLMLVGAVSIVVGALAALGQRDVKRLLAYSSISQVGYIVLGLGCGTPLGIAGAVFHLFNHAVFKSLLFVNAAALEGQLGTTEMDRMGGLGQKMPVTGFTSVIGVLSTAGVPPLGGFWSKLVIIVALWQAHHHAYAVIAVMFSVVTLAYLLVFQRKVFFGQTPDSLAGVREAPREVVVAALALAGLTLGIGLLFPLLTRTFLLPTSGAF
jgi:multicomponent Na+:H+ antiporter subunit D